MEFISAEEKEQLGRKLDDLKAKRPVLSQRIAEARALGDLKENADYHAAREDQGLNEAEIRRLEERIKKAHVASNDHVPEGMIFLGSVVKLKDLTDNSQDLYKLVGESTGRFDMDHLEVTTSSPMGEALLKARVGDVVKVDLPRGPRQYEVVEIC